MVFPLIAAGVGATFGALSERYGWNVPNYRDVGNIAMGEDTGVEANALYRAKQILIAEEGRRNIVYVDTRGFPTGGIGHRILAGENFRVGDNISESQIEAWFTADVSKAFNAAVSQSREIDKYNVEMIARLTSVNFQLGTSWRSDFPNTWSYIKNGDVESAVRNLIQSRWNQQTPGRVANLIITLRNQFA